MTILSLVSKVFSVAIGSFFRAQKLLPALALSCLALSSSAFAQSEDIQLQVSATVMKHASLEVLSQPSSVLVTASDIDAGFVDVPVPAHVSVQSNTPAGYHLMFDTQGDFIQKIIVKGLDSEVQMGMAGGGIFKRGTGMGMVKSTLTLAFRFILSKSATRGLYAWPMRLSVMPH